MNGAAGHLAKTSGSRIAGVVSCVPRRIISNDHFVPAFGDKVEEVSKMTGVRQRRWAAEGETTADLCQTAASTLLAKLGWESETVDGVIFVSQTPDYRLPATACALQDRLGLQPGAIAFDVNLGCSGYPYGLWLAMMAIQTGAARRILLLVGDTISKVVDPGDRSTAMLFGDAGTATALESSDDGEPSNAHFILGTDGRGERNLIVPRGGYRTGFEDDESFAGRNLDALYMDGGEIFNFTLKSVPPLIEATIAAAQGSMEDYDAFLLHQANAFMIKHLSKKAKLPAEKVPMNIDRYGNTSSATIPLLMTSELAPLLRTQRARLGLFGFGVGYSWASASIDVGPLACVETIES
jgi:3-oxoacyl-[acyl-carrier-protein] synthase III